MNNLALIKREQIGQALEYAEPRKAIQNIHERYADRLNQFSTVTKLRTVGAVDRNGYRAMREEE